MLDSLQEWQNPPDYIVIIDNGLVINLDKFNHSLIDVSNLKIQSGLNLLRPERNMGVASSWNWFLKNVPVTAMVIANDDIEIFEETFQQLYASLKQYSNAPLISVNDSWSLFILRKKALYQPGLFDENFWPAYFEDNDYDYRIKLSGLPRGNIQGKLIHHVSTALKTYTEKEKQQHDKRFRDNQRYYASKWGGMPGKERFKKPAI